MDSAGFFFNSFFNVSNTREIINSILCSQLPQDSTPGRAFYFKFLKVNIAVTKATSCSRVKEQRTGRPASSTQRQHLFAPEAALPVSRTWMPKENSVFTLPLEPCPIVSSFVSLNYIFSRISAFHRGIWQPSAICFRSSVHLKGGRPTPRMLVRGFYSRIFLP